jgi:hypothetical protein
MCLNIPASRWPCPQFLLDRIAYIFLAVVGFWFRTKIIKKAPCRMQGASAEGVTRHDLQ